VAKRVLDNPYQLPLFTAADGEDVASVLPPLPTRMDAIRSIEWSHSRRSSLDKCPRRYYYDYYGANKLTAKGEPAKELLHFLKGLDNRYLRSGHILHLAIANSLRKGWDLGTLLSFASRIYDADLAYSAEHPIGDFRPPGDYPPVLLLEYFYGHEDAESLALEARARLLSGLRAFATDDVYTELRAGGAMPGAYIEVPFSLPGFPCRVTGRIDLAFPQGNGLTIVDWKLSADSGAGDDSLQLAAYALWGVHKLGYEASQIRVCKAYLLSGQIADFPVDAALLRLARARILQDAEGMAAMHELGKTAVAEAFTPVRKPAVCAMCPFKRECYG
jgi:hypothetical protein